jgi:hypothetical protein
MSGPSGTRSDVPGHNDYLFATKDLAGGLVDCYAVSSDEGGAWSISDHCPVVARTVFRADREYRCPGLGAPRWPPLIASINRSGAS